MNKLQVLALILVLAAIPVSIYFLNIRVYNAAKALEQVSRASTLDDALILFDRSIEGFGPLANYPRLVLFRSLVENWENLSESATEKVLAIVEDESSIAIESEPENWRIYAALAQLYGKASDLDARYVELAESYLEKAKEMAPNRGEVTGQ